MTAIEDPRRQRTAGRHRAPAMVPAVGSPYDEWPTAAFAVPAGLDAVTESFPVVDAGRTDVIPIVIVPAQPLVHVPEQRRRSGSLAGWARRLGGS